MPFDTTKLRQPVVTVLPPTPPEHGGEPQRFVINIEIVQRQPPKRGYRFGTLTLVLLILAVLGALAGCTAAHADDGAFHYDHWQDTNGWHGETRRQGRTTDWDAYGPRGEQKHCHQHFVGDQSYTNCH